MGRATLVSALTLSVVAPLGSPPLATVSNRHAGARPVALTLALGSFPLVCGRPSGTLVVRLPTAMKLPPSIPTQAVRLDHAAAGATSVRAHVVTIGAAMPHGITCDVVTLGKLELVFTRSAGLGNPSAPGRYAIVVQHSSTSYRATLTIES